MNTKWKRLATILWLSSVVLSGWIWAYAAQNESSLDEVFNGSRSSMMINQQHEPGDVLKHLEKDWDNSENKSLREERWGRFWLAFIDQESLTDVQKTEIENIQNERDEAIKKINDEFFDKLEKYISEDKLENYENFVTHQENIKWMPHKKRKHKMSGENIMKNIQKPKEINEERED